MPFELVAPYSPSGDQPQAIDKLVSNFRSGVSRQTLLGVTGSGKTFTIANVIRELQLPTLVISHNKTLAGQLYQEFKELFPRNHVSYFVSYYDYYQPEAYMPASDTYIAKEVEINDLIDKLRLEATSNLFEGDDNITVASVSCIYNIGDPIQFSGLTLDLIPGQTYPRRQLLEKLIKLFYTRSEMEFKRATFRVRGNIIDLWPSYSDWTLSLEFDPSDKLTIIYQRHPFTGNEFVLDRFRLYPAKQFVGTEGKDMPTIFAQIRADMEAEVAKFKTEGKILEAHRLAQRVNYDLEMIEEIGYVNGIENYSIYFENQRQKGDPPYTLVDYYKHRFGDNFLTVIDESHVTIPQIGGMYSGDFARKQTLIDFGFRLSSARDNRPLTFDEFNRRVKNVFYISATPAPYEIADSQKYIIEQIIRPTGLTDPPITILPEKGQIPDLLTKIQANIVRGQRTLVLTLTKRMAEDLTAFLSEPANTGSPIKVAYLHSDIETLERSDILSKLRAGDFDVLVGINLLREGIDLPEVSLVAILDAGNQGFLRSTTALIQIMGRAARHVDGQVILYTDRISPAIRQAVAEVDRRRQIQLEYNRVHHITPETIQKSIRPQIIKSDKVSAARRLEPAIDRLLSVELSSLTPPEKKKHLTLLRREMRAKAADMDFEAAIKLRDRIKEISSN